MIQPYACSFEPQVKTCEAGSAAVASFHHTPRVTSPFWGSSAICVHAPLVGASASLPSVATAAMSRSPSPVPGGVAMVIVWVELSIFVSLNAS